MSDDETFETYADEIKLVAERFWAKVDKRGPDECWDWVGGKGTRGYGSHRRLPCSKPERTNRISYEIHYGKIPAGMFVCHRCDRPECVNPAHLWLGTPADNAADMATKGRAAPKSGCLNGRAKLSPVQVQEIKARLRAGVQGRTLAREFGVSDMAISRIKRGRLWRHMEASDA
jgi:hypothetical protein